MADPPNAGGALRQPAGNKLPGFRMDDEPQDRGCSW
jgi:hypothetical protein